MNFIDVVLLTCIFVLYKWRKKTPLKEMAKPIGKFFFGAIFIKSLMMYGFILDILPVCYGDYDNAPYCCNQFVDSDGNSARREDFQLSKFTLFYPAWYLYNSYQSYTNISNNKAKDKIYDTRYLYEDCIKDMRLCSGYISQMARYYSDSPYYLNFAKKHYDEKLTDDRDFCLHGSAVIIPSFERIRKRTGLNQYYILLRTLSERAVRIGCLRIVGFAINRLIPMNGIYLLEKLLNEEFFQEMSYKQKKEVLSYIWSAQKRIRVPVFQEHKDEAVLFYKKKCKDYHVLNCEQ